MNQIDLGGDLSTRRTRKQILLEEMNEVMPWGRKLPYKVNKLKIETSISLRVRDEEVKIYRKSDCWNIG